MKVLVINSGSSSIKFALYRDEEVCLAEQVEGSDLNAVFERLRGEHFDAVGHRVVHGGKKFTSPCVIDKEVIQAIRALAPFDPEHLPHALAAIDAVAKTFPNVPQVACFDTAFHREMPTVSKMFALPRKYYDEGILRYGFHGLSYEYITERLKEIGDPGEKVIVAHLGNGASMAAILKGKSIDTTMGFTPTAGLVMSSRSGDLDPGVLLYLLKEKKMSEEELGRLLNEESGLLGVSSYTSNMKELLKRQDPNCQEAVSLFCYRAKKTIASLMAALEGLDTLVFTGGIGENSAEIRKRILSGMSFAGITLNEEKNQKNGEIISSSSSQVLVRVLKTNEELMIARHTKRVL